MKYSFVYRNFLYHNHAVRVLVIINNFNLIRTVFCPDKTNTILIIDTNTMLSFSFSRQGFQAIARRDFQFQQSSGRIDLIKFTCSNSPHAFRACPSRSNRIFAIEYIFGSRIFEGLYHGYMITRNLCYFKGQIMLL
jgi:hypothetical protein